LVATTDAASYKGFEIIAVPALSPIKTSAIACVVVGLRESEHEFSKSDIKLA
jgi:hypothetical protein